MEERRSDKKQLPGWFWVGLLLALIGYGSVHNSRAATDPLASYYENLYHDAISALPETPDDPGIRYLLGLCYFKLGWLYREMHHLFVSLSVHGYDLLDARVDYLEGAAPPSLYTSLFLGLAFCENGDYEQGGTALNHYITQQREQLSKKKDDEDATVMLAIAWCALGECYTRLGSTNEASGAFQSIDPLVEKQPLVELCLAQTYQRLGVNSEQVRQIYQRVRDDLKTNGEEAVLVTGVQRVYPLIFAQLSASKGNFGDALRWAKRIDLAEADFRESLAVNLTLEFFSPRLLGTVGEIYLRYAHSLFETLAGDLSDLRGDLDYANALILVELGEYLDAEKILEAILERNPTNKVLKGCVQILLGQCYHAQDRRQEASRVWQSVQISREESNSTQAERLFLAVELAKAYVDANMNGSQAAELINSALSGLSELQTDSLPLYPPLEAFPSSKTEVYRRAGNALLGLSEYGDDAVNPALLGLKPEESLLDFAVRTYRRGQVVKKMYKIGKPPEGNDPLLLINIAYADYKREFNFWGNTVETFALMQNTYPELYSLHLMIQQIRAIRNNFHQDIRNPEKWRKR